MADTEIEREFAGVHRTGAAEGHQGEIARIEAAFDGDDANRALHVGIDDANHAARRERGLWSASRRQVRR